MNASSASTARKRFVVPRENRATLALPSLEDAGELMEKNIRLRETGAGECLLLGRSLADLSRQARKDLLEAALAWTTSYRDVNLPSLDPDGPMFVAGHQPELFHPGVWYKNFALGELSRRYRAAAVNLVIDSDTLKSTALSVPCGSPDDPRRESVLFDRPDPWIPFEERPVLDERLFCNFGHRVNTRIAGLVPDPLIVRFWPLVLERARHCDRLGYCLAQARHQLEGEWGVQTLEAPQSAVCSSEPFHWFLVHMFANIERFRECYNAAVHEYREANGIANAAHPVPDLTADGPWIESPLWIWTTAQPQRRRLFVCHCGDDVVVSDRAGQKIRLSLGATADPAAAVRQLMAWSRQGVKIRSRALVTTLWARLALSDLFLHGIGGAKYDQVTDRLIEKFFGLSAPGIMVLSATLYLPVPRPEASLEQLGAIRHNMRELQYHPEKFLRESNESERDATAAKLAAEKRHWIDAPTTIDNAYARWKAIGRVNNELQSFVSAQQQQLLDQQAEVQRALRHDKVLGSREYGFCLFPESYLRDFFGALLPKNA